MRDIFQTRYEKLRKNVNNCGQAKQSIANCTEQVTCIGEHVVCYGQGQRKKEEKWLYDRCTYCKFCIICHFAESPWHAYVHAREGFQVKLTTLAVRSGETSPFCISSSMFKSQPDLPLS